MSQGTPQSSQAPLRDDIQVALAEFNALRAEIVANQTTQTTVLTVGLTLIGVLFSVALQEAGDRRLLLVIPVVGLVVTLLNIAYRIAMYRLADYVRREFGHTFNSDRAIPAPGSSTW